MKIAKKPKDVIKLCHAAIGSAVLLVSDKLDVDDEPFLVCAAPEKGKRAARSGITHGLYDDERSLFLVSLRTGLMREPPHLSSRVIIFSDAEVNLGAETPRGALAELEQEVRQIKVGAQSPAVTAERVLEKFVTVFVPDSEPERLCFEMAQRVLANGNSTSSR